VRFERGRGEGCSTITGSRSQGPAASAPDLRAGTRFILQARDEEKLRRRRGANLVSNAGQILGRMRVYDSLGAATSGTSGIR